MIKPRKTPRDINQLAALIVSLSTGQTTVPQDPEDGLTPEQRYAKEFARKGGLAGGKARAKALSPKKRKEIATKAAAARWGKTGPRPGKK